VRCQIVARLAGGEKAATEVAEPFTISRPAVSRHLRVLRESGIVLARVQGRKWIYSIDPDCLRETTVWLEQVHEMWRETVHAFKKYVEEQE